MHACIHGIQLQNISTGLSLFGKIFQKNSERVLDPPTHFHSNLRFFSFLIHHYFCNNGSGTILLLRPESIQCNITNK